MRVGYVLRSHLYCGTVDLALGSLGYGNVDDWQHNDQHNDCKYQKVCHASIKYTTRSVGVNVPHHQNFLQWFFMRPFAPGFSPGGYSLFMIPPLPWGVVRTSFSRVVDSLSSMSKALLRANLLPVETRSSRDFASTKTRKRHKLFGWAAERGNQCMLNRTRVRQRDRSTRQSKRYGMRGKQIAKTWELGKAQKTSTCAECTETPSLPDRK